MKYKHYSVQDYLYICELFITIQGEGINTGIPSVFIRFSGCNLQCKFCDSPYTWNWKGTNFIHNTKTWEKSKYNRSDEMSPYTPKELVNKVHTLAGSSIKTVVLTGGEPMLYYKTFAFKQLLKLLKIHKFKIEVETNGTIRPDNEVVKYIDQFNVSVKLSNSGMPEKRRIIDNPISFFNRNIKSVFKFVIAAKSDIEEIKVLQNKFNILPEKILLMPEGRTEEEIKDHAKFIVDLCINNGYRFCNRAHIWLWGGSIRKV